MIVNIDVNFILNMGAAITLGIWGYKFTKTFLEWLISESGKKQRRPPQ